MKNGECVKAKQETIETKKEIFDNNVHDGILWLLYEILLMPHNGFYSTAES